jgi:hypothetical protein
MPADVLVGVVQGFDPGLTRQRAEIVEGAAGGAV